MDVHDWINLGFVLLVIAGFWTVQAWVRTTTLTVTETCAWCDDGWSVTAPSAAKADAELTSLQVAHEARWHGACVTSDPQG